MASSENFCISLTSFIVGQYNTSFTFSSSILIPSGSITTPKNPTFLTFYLHFSSFMYKSFFAILFTTSSTTLWWPSSSSVSTIILSMKLATSLVLIKSYRILFIIVWNVARKLVSPKNITVGSNDPSRVINADFYNLSVGQKKEFYIRFTQENSIENLVQNCLPCILRLIVCVTTVMSLL